MPNGATREALEDYALTLNCAKEISMIQRSEKGKIARQYFIECEKQLKEVMTKKELREPSENEIKIKLMEAEAKLLAEKRLTLEMVTNQVHKEIIISKFYSDEKHLLPLPEVGEKSYSATELSSMIQKKYGLNLSANKIGRIANENGLKTSENGIFLYDKSKYSEKTVESFKYYERCMDKIVSLFKKERKKSKSDSIIF
jgi:phage antirepressor protein